MPRTITGTYTLRPTSFYSYRSSGTFSDYFATSPSAPSNWTTKMNMDRQIGDNSDSTYYSDTGVTSGNSNAENALMNLTVTDGTVPEFDYTITSVKLTWRCKSSSQTDGTRVLNLWFSIWDTKVGESSTYTTPNQATSNGNFGMKVGYGSSSSLHTSTTSIANHSYTITAASVLQNSTLVADAYPNRMAICARAYKTSAFVSFNSWQLYDVWFEVSYTYTENEVRVQWANDEGVEVSSNGSPLGAYETYADYRGTSYPLIATIKPGYILDGYYLNGTKVASTNNYTYTFRNQADRLYCITKKRKVFVGTYQVDEIYIGINPIKELYDGTEKIWGNSDLYDDATDPIGSVG